MQKLIESHDVDSVSWRAHFTVDLGICGESGMLRGQAALLFKELGDVSNRKLSGTRLSGDESTGVSESRGELALGVGAAEIGDGRGG